MRIWCTTKPTPPFRFWDRPRTTLEQKHLNKKLAKKAKKDAAKRRLEKYKKRLAAQKPPIA
jgi:hypothetical protein